MELTQDEVLQVIKLVEESEFDELELEMDGLKLVVRRGDGAVPSGKVEAIVAAPRGPAPAAKQQVAEKQEKPGPSAPPSPKAAGPAGVAPAPGPGEVAIVAPTVGTFYRSPKPGAPPFVQVGSFVNEDDTVCILEVMKCFISVKAMTKGYVTRVSAQNEELVEFGQQLFLVKVGDKVESATR